MAGRSINRYLLVSWVISLLLAVIGAGLLSLGISYLDYSNHRQGAELKLHDDARLVARRMAAELLLGRNGRPEAVTKQLLSEFALTDLTVSDARKIERPTNGDVRVSEAIPSLLQERFVTLTRRGTSLSRFINFRNFLFALLPILGLALSGFAIQRYFLRRYVIRPIQALSETSIGDRPVKPYWPLEIQRIAADLAESFSSREQAIFGKLSQGLIHDMRTQINSINTALQLVQEANPGTAERSSRLAKLESACSRNIPKIRELVDLSLDSSREIVVRPKSGNLSNTVQQAILNIQDLAAAKGVTIESAHTSMDLIRHDRLQLERVFTNLIKNAVEAVEGQASPNRRVLVGAEAVPSGLTITVEDSGQGFADPTQIFRPLKTTKTHGYGLGLFVSKKIVEAHRGRLDAGRSERLGGAKFTVFIPDKEIGA